MKISCAIAEDLLPLYADESCSHDSRVMLEEHLAECPACREKLKRMRDPEYISGRSPAPDNRTAGMAAYARKVRRHRIAAGIGIVALLILVGAGSSALAIWSRNASDESLTSELGRHYAMGGIVQKQKQLHGDSMSSPQISVNYCVLEMGTDIKARYPHLAEKIDSLNARMEKQAQELRDELMEMEGEEYGRLDAALNFQIYRSDEKVFSAALLEDVSGKKGHAFINLRSEAECMNLDPETGETLELFRKEGSDTPGLLQNEDRLLKIIYERITREGYLKKMRDDERIAFMKDYLFGSKARWCVSDEEVCWFYDPADFTGEDDGGGVRADGVLMSELGEYF